MNKKINYSLILLVFDSEQIDTGFVNLINPGIYSQKR
jgi:hypothetical protein